MKKWVSKKLNERRKRKKEEEEETCGLYYKNILTILSDDGK
jgi:hypothetical protein